MGGRFSFGVSEGDIWRGKTGLEGQLGGAEKRGLIFIGKK